jgi:hypothetical protein
MIHGCRAAALQAVVIACGAELSPSFETKRSCCKEAKVEARG